MALIEKFVVVANHYPVHTGEEILEGMLVKLNSSGEVIKATGASGELCIGVAGDTKSVSTSAIPVTNNAVIGAPAESQQFVNRISDTFDETKASGRMTVYQLGTYATNMIEVGQTPAVNDPLYVGANGKWTTTPSTSGQIIGYCTKSIGAYDSGVPGVDLAVGSMSLGNYFEFKLVV